MSRIPTPGDRPIPTNEPTVATQQTSETESGQKTDVSGKAPLEAEVITKEPVTTDSKGAQYESRLAGLARQSELQLQFPIPTGPTLKNLPDLNPNLDPNVHLDEKVDVTKNLPDGQVINKGLDGLDWGPNKAKTGPGHFGVEMTYGGMKAPTDVLAGVVNSRNPAQVGVPDPHKPNPGADSKKVGDLSKLPPGAELSSRAPNHNLVGTTPEEYQTIFPVPNVTGGSAPPASSAGKDIDAMKQRLKEKTEAAEKKKNAPDGGTKMTDPESGVQTPSTLSPEELARVIAVNKGDTDTVRGFEGTVIEGDKPPLRYGELVKDPTDTGDATDVKSTSGGNVIIGGGYTDGPRKDIPVGPPPGGGTNPSNKGEF